MQSMELLILKELNSNGMGICLRPTAQPVITVSLTKEIRQLQDSIVEKYYQSPWEGYFYLVWYLDNSLKSLWSGFDFKFIDDAFRNHRETEAEAYIDRIFDIIFLNYIGMGLPLINCSILNKEVTSLSREFFLLNAISFIHCKHKTQTPFIPVSIDQEFKHLTFKEAIYQNNHCFYFDSLRFGIMRRIIQSIDRKALSDDEIKAIKKEFDAVKTSTLMRIYSIASHRRALFAWLANRQAIAGKILSQELTLE
ncbi:hypothetical protein [Legionella erythra]|uniref:Uncharacterized protein n=1 Tax=Legionella erythra TaxID=448 RepID=A0A0W0TKL4_LEGER|nr:hypothetical protein [Legionella erythra]KTC96115.1 hypothetical protein Lery_1907 [Legionella erythra]